MFASISKSYQVDLTGSYRLAGLFSQLGGLVQPKGWAAFGQNRSLKALICVKAWRSLPRKTRRNRPRQPELLSLRPAPLTLAPSPLDGPERNDQ